MTRPGSRIPQTPQETLAETVAKQNEEIDRLKKTISLAQAYVTTLESLIAPHAVRALPLVPTLIQLSSVLNMPSAFLTPSAAPSLSASCSAPAVKQLEPGKEVWPGEPGEEGGAREPTASKKPAAVKEPEPAAKEKPEQAKKPVANQHPISLRKAPKPIAPWTKAKWVAAARGWAVHSKSGATE